MYLGAMTFNTLDAQTACDTAACTVNVPRGGRGASRDLVINPGLTIHATEAYSGTFYTNADLTEPRQATDADAVQQYLAPGLTIGPLAALQTCKAVDGDYAYICTDAPIDSTPFRLNPFVTGAN